VPDPQATIGSLALGIAGGLVVAVLAEQDWGGCLVARSSLFQRWLRVPLHSAMPAQMRTTMASVSEGWGRR
jgi:hypothetical protein